MTLKDKEKLQKKGFDNSCFVTTEKVEKGQHGDSNTNDVAIRLGSVISNTKRAVLPQKSFDEIYKLDRPKEPSLKSKVKKLSQMKCFCSGQIAWQMLQKRIPMLAWLPKYNLKSDLISDILGGITVGIMQIPQGMAYALLANLPPVVGLYVSFFSVLVYFALGTSRHLSLGTFAVVSLMTSKVINSYVTKHGVFVGNVTSTTSLFNDTMSSLDDNNNSTLLTTSIPDTVSSSVQHDLTTLKIQVAAAAAFFVGVLQLVMAILQLGALSVYLSDTLVSGFTTGAAVHVFTSQVKYLFGISIPNHGGLLAVLYAYIDIFSSLHKTNLVTLALSASVIISLLLVNDCINARYRSRMIMPVPMELIVIVITTFSSYYLNLNQKYNVQIVNNIPTGIPPPTLPRLDIIPNIATDCLSLAIVSYCIPISLAKLSAKKFKYDIDANQELVAYGSGNIVGSFFSCFPSCGSLSRSTVQELSGAKTQVASLISCGFILIVLLLIAPLFEPVPNCVLAGVIVVALRGMFRQFGDLQSAWNTSKREAAVWLVSFIAVVLLDVDLGLLVAICFLLITVLYRLQRPYSTTLGNVPTTDVYLDIQKYKVPREVQGLKIVHFGGALFFANRDYFRQQMYKLVFNPQQEIAKRKKKEKFSKRIKSDTTISCQNLVQDFKSDSDYILYPQNGNSPAVYGTAAQDYYEPHTQNPSASFGGNHNSPETVTSIIIDCSVMSFIDSPAMSMLAQLHTEYGDVGVNLYLSGCKDNILMKLEKSDCFAKLQDNLFPTIHDAVLHVSQSKSEISNSKSSQADNTHL